MLQSHGEKNFVNTKSSFNSNDSGTHCVSGNQSSVANASSNSTNGGEPKIDSQTFPEHLMDIIEEETRCGHGVLEWAAGGESFVVQDKMKLETEVLPRHFNAKCKYMSFFRKLYRWGFRQLEKNSPNNNLIFYNKHFKRGDKKQCLLMRSIVKRPSSTVTSRAAAKTTGAKANRAYNFDEMSNNPHGMQNGIMTNNTQIQNEILTSLQLQGGGAGVMSFSSFASQQDGFNNSFGFPSLGNTDNIQMHMSMVSNTQQQQQHQQPDFMKSLYSGGSNGNSISSQTVVAAPNRLNAWEDSSQYNTDSTIMSQNFGNDLSKDMNSNNMIANFSSTFPATTGNNQRGILPMGLLQASLSNFRSIETNQIQSQLDTLKRFCFNSSPPKGSCNSGCNSYSGGGNFNNSNWGPN